jgi:uncharacterized membrane-anchored protein
MNIRIFVAMAALASSSAVGEAKPFKEMFPGLEYSDQKTQQFVEGLDYKDGVNPLTVGGVRLNIPKGFYYLSADHARRVVVDAWGNPPATGENILGMILPSSKSPIEDTWGAIITFDEDGYVSDEDAAKINYSDLLKEMQTSIAQDSEERVKQGFGSIRLVGWASPPYYDPATHKLHWAKELEFDGSPQHTLNYDVRALGRKGVLKMNFVAGMQQLTEIKSVIPAVMGMPEFVVGSRYEDYVPGTDKVAAYGLGALIAGKLASKAGLLVLALAFLKKGWILIVLAIGGFWKLIARFFKGKTQS